MLSFGRLGKAAAWTRCLPSTPPAAAAAAGSHAITAARSSAAAAAAAAAAARPRASLRHSPCLDGPSFAFRCFSVSSHSSSSSNSSNSSNNSSSSSSDVVRQFSSVDLERAASGSSPHKIQNLRAAALLHEEEVFGFFVKCIQLTMPKSKAQAEGEVKLVRSFLENFSGDNIRFALQGSFVSGDHQGQQTHSYRLAAAAAAAAADAGALGGGLTGP
ncbi:hypothetical protein Emed_002407 [Eimeria media]